MEARYLLAALVTFAFAGTMFACATEDERDDLLPHELASETEDPLRGGNCAKSKAPHCADAGTPTSTVDAAPPPAPTTCSSFTYSAFGACQPDGTQTRTVLTSSPAGCTGGAPVLSQACTYTAPQPSTCTSFTYSAWGACQPNGTQARTLTSSSPAGCTGGTPVLSQSCTYVDGAALYTQYCAGCHGTSKKGSSATSIQSAIDSNKGGMGSLSFLTPAQVAAIAAAP
jgi:hypothetical protein